MRVILDEISNEEDWRSIIAYIQTFPLTNPLTSLLGNTTHGAKLYQTCAGCHDASDTRRAELGAPNLTLLQDWYIADQLRKFRIGLRGANPEDSLGSQMKAATAVLQSDQDIVDVATYIASRSTKTSTPTEIN
jgi:cytochrome c oxidase subunit 2